MPLNRDVRDRRGAPGALQSAATAAAADAAATPGAPATEHVPTSEELLVYDRGHVQADLARALHSAQSCSRRAVDMTASLFCRLAWITANAAQCNVRMEKWTAQPESRQTLDAREPQMFDK